MIEERRKMNLDIIGADTDEQILARFVWYVQNYNPVDEERCEHYEMIKAEILRRMQRWQ